MLLETLRYKEEIREADPYFEDIEEPDVANEQVELAKELIQRKTAPFNPSKFHDTYRDALQELIDAKIEKRDPREIETAKPSSGKIVNLMDALKKSLKAKDANDNAPAKTRAAKKAPAKGKKPAAKKTPVKGGAAKKAAQKTVPKNARQKKAG